MLIECPKKTFSCDNWKPHKQEYSATCVSMEKRCDSVTDCPNGKDEKDCELLADDIYSHEVSYLERKGEGRKKLNEKVPSISILTMKL